MKFFSEKEAENFLDKFGFKVLERKFVNNKSQLSSVNFNFPWVMKVSGSKIVHKKNIGGVFLNVKNLEEANNIFDKIKKIEGAEGVLIQPQIFGKEFFVGIKKTEDFGHVLVFGKGGSDVEREKDVSFRVYPVSEEDVLEMISETKIGRKISRVDKALIEKVLLNVNFLVNKNKTISELDINPFINGKVVDARIIFE